MADWRRHTRYAGGLQPDAKEVKLFKGCEGWRTRPEKIMACSSSRRAPAARARRRLRAPRGLNGGRHRSRSTRAGTSRRRAADGAARASARSTCRPLLISRRRPKSCGGRRPRHAPLRRARRARVVRRRRRRRARDRRGCGVFRVGNTPPTFVRARLRALPGVTQSRTSGPPLERPRGRLTCSRNPSCVAGSSTISVTT